jgi:hypothetical protein
VITAFTLLSTSLVIWCSEASKCAILGSICGSPAFWTWQVQPAIVPKLQWCHQISSIINAYLSFAKRKKSRDAEMGSTEGQVMTCLARNSGTQKVEWADILWQRNKSLVHHFLGHSCCRHCKTSKKKWWFTGCLCGISLWCTITWMSKNIIRIFFTLEQTCMAFFGRGDDGLFY